MKELPSLLLQLLCLDTERALVVTQELKNLYRTLKGEGGKNFVKTCALELLPRTQPTSRRLLLGAQDLLSLFQIPAAFPPFL